MSEKYYQLGTHTAEQWCEIYNELTDSTGSDTVPCRCVSCVDDKSHSPTRGIFLLTNEEAESLKLDPRVRFINIDYTSYPEQFRPPPEEIQASSPSFLKRWDNAVKVYRRFIPNNNVSDIQTLIPDSDEINRTNYGLLRPTQKIDPWLDGFQRTSRDEVPILELGSFDSFPNTWTQGSNTLVAFFGFSEQFAGEYLVTVQGPTTVNVLLDPAGARKAGRTTGIATVTTEVEILDSSGSRIDVKNHGPSIFTKPSDFAGTQGPAAEVNPRIEEINILLPNEEIYEIYYRSTLVYNEGNSDDFDWAFGINCELGVTPLTPFDRLQRNLEQISDGRDVDVIVPDDAGGWIGHPEFQNNTTGPPPKDYIGGNVLPGNGTCDVLDLALDAPYYLDPDYFDADPTNRLITRWDGTRVPVESVARDWWSNTNNRSSKFNAEYPIAGTVTVSSNYTRANCNGSNTEISAVGNHATPCMALTYGRTQGWAYNSNKWTLNLYGSFGSDIEPGFDLQKIFHLTKPVNPKYGTKNPTISSNSWGFRSAKNPGGQTWYYNFRNSSNVPYTQNNNTVAFIDNMGRTGDTIPLVGPRWKSEMKINSLTTALDELIDSGVIFVVASGNSNQKQTNWGHPDFDNYITQTNGSSLEDSSFFEFGIEVTGTTNRRGFPQQGGKTTDPVTGEIKYKTINIGALDDNQFEGRERKVNYSDRGEGIDFYMPADGILAANRASTDRGIYPDTYPGFTANSGTGRGAGVATETAFSGTSAACPVASGFIACLVGLNRNWTYQDVKSYFQSLDVQDPTQFFYGIESASVSDSNWYTYTSLEGGDARVGYQDLSKISQTTFPIRKSRVSNGITVKGISINYVQRFDRG